LLLGAVVAVVTAGAAERVGAAVGAVVTLSEPDPGPESLPLPESLPEPLPSFPEPLLSIVVSGAGCVVVGNEAVDGGRADVEVVPAVVGTGAGDVAGFVPAGTVPELAAGDDPRGAVPSGDVGVDVGVTEARGADPAGVVADPGAADPPGAAALAAVGGVPLAAEVATADVGAPTASAAAPPADAAVATTDAAEASATAIDLIVSAATGRVGDQTTASFTELGEVRSNALVVAITPTPQAIAAAPTATLARRDLPTPPVRASSGTRGLPI
jgi:hypothetical protein